MLALRLLGVLSVPLTESIDRTIVRERKKKTYLTLHLSIKSSRCTPLRRHREAQGAAIGDLRLAAAALEVHGLRTSQPC